MSRRGIEAAASLHCGPFHRSRRILSEPGVDDNISKRWVWHGTPIRLSVNDSHGTWGRNSPQSAVHLSGAVATATGNHPRRLSLEPRRRTRTRTRGRLGCTIDDRVILLGSRAAGGRSVGRRGMAGRGGDGDGDDPNQTFPPSSANALLLNVYLLRTGCCC
jgi:hypothetical protein